MKSHSIYTALYNANKMGFPWRETLDNWTSFLNGEGQISIAINTSDDGTLNSVSSYVEQLKQLTGNQVEYTITATDISYQDPLFDGKIKNEALKRCNREVCTLLDIDEVLPLSNREAWNSCIEALQFGHFDALFVPVIDFFHDVHSYKSMGQKWYMHRNLPNLMRGRVNFAEREDGTTDISRSDTCELIYDTGRLVYATGLVGMNLPERFRLELMAGNQLPYVIHLGWLNKQQRLRQSAFWAPVWNARNGSEVEKPLTENELDMIPHYPHNLKHWNQE